MNAASSLVEIFGWTLLHFLWQGTVVGLVLWMVLLLARKYSAHLRYNLAGVGMLITIACPIITFIDLSVATMRQTAPSGLTTLPAAVKMSVQASNAVETKVFQTPPTVDRPVATARTQARPELPINWGQRIRPYLMGIVALWALGVACLTVRFWLGWRKVGGMKNSGHLPENVMWTERFQRLQKCLRISRPILLLVSATATVPMVIGWLKPVVLVPTGLFLGLSGPQMEAIFAHELAHIRRQDFLVNLSQVVVEILFFYHPAVWWISAQIRKEREHCCDDIAASVTGSVLEYARALTVLEELRDDAPMPVVSAVGGSLLSRIRRLMGFRQPDAGGSIWSVAALVILLLAVLGPVAWLRAGGEPPPTPAGGKAASLLERWQTVQERDTPISESNIKTWATATSGHWPMVGGVQLHIYGEVFHGADVATTAVLTWPAQNDQPAHHWYTQVARDAFANRELWAVAWESDQAVLWIASRDLGIGAQRGSGKPIANRFKRVDFSNPNLITETSFTGWPRQNRPSPEVIALMATYMEVPNEGEAADSLYSWTSVGSPERIDFAAVQNISLRVEKDGSLVVDLGEKKSSSVMTLQETINQLMTEWRAKRQTLLGNGLLTERVTLWVPQGYSDQGVAGIVKACSEAGCGPNQPATADGSSPTVRGLNLKGMPIEWDVTNIHDLYELAPNKVREFRQKAGVFSMSLGDVGPWVYFAANSDHFYIERRPNPKIVKDLIYGPIPGHPVEKLNLAEWLRESPTHPDPGYAARVARDMIKCGDTTLGGLALDWLGTIKTPSPPDEHNWLITAIEEHLKVNPQSAITDKSRSVLAQLKAVAEQAESKWGKLREQLPAERYSPGAPTDDARATISWSEAAENGLKIGIDGVEADSKWAIGSDISLDVYVRNDGKNPVKFAWTPRIDEGLSASLKAPNDEVWHASMTMWSTLIFHNRCQLEPGQKLKVKSAVQFRILRSNADPAKEEPEHQGNSFSLDGPGKCQLEIECSLGVSDWTDSQGTPHPRPVGEWSGTLRSKPIEVEIKDGNSAKVIEADPANNDDRPVQVASNITKDPDQQIHKDPFSPPTDPAELAAARQSGIFLKVLDSTGQHPIKEFRVISGVPSSVSSEFEKSQGRRVSNWQSHTLHIGSEGALLWPLDKAYDDMALRVEADGYVPQEFAWVDKKKGAQDLVFTMVEDQGIVGSVMAPGGKSPAPNATVVLAMIRRDARLKGATAPGLDLAELPEAKSLRDVWDRPRIVHTDAQGKFTLPTEIDFTAVVLIFNQDGVKELPYAKWKESPVVVLESWRSIKGHVQWGEQEGAGEVIDLSVDHGDAYGYPGILSQSGTVTADAQGNFVFERVLPGQVQLSIPFKIRGEKGEEFTAYQEGMMMHADVRESPTEVMMGGKGRTVKGKLTGRDSWDGVVFHFHPTAPHIGFEGDNLMWKAWKDFKDSPKGPVFFRDGLKVMDDGSFEITGVLPGSYQIFFSREGEKSQVASGQFRLGEENGKGQTTPMDVGEIKAKVVEN